MIFSRTAFKSAVATIVALTLFGAASTYAQDAETLRPASEIEAIGDERERSLAAYEEVAKVVTHPRCMNCHPRDSSPRQGMDMAMHQPPVVRGVDDFGAPAMRCATCHGNENVSYVGSEGSIPGHDPWHVAPLSMGWIGLSKGAICEQLKDPERNGDRTMAEIHEHMAEDGLVGWAWNPGEGREPAPGTQDVFGQLTKLWIDNGAHCPTS
ncbi:hypothetical protein [Ahrensia sp. R2A130]|uniref:hypothetical protein n=1 Tax=Ahrensia sp. R2A130 TaxID=744979 RepID=UPI0001E0A4E7|nr:hypothetical protein [Ahrensia sp. R2A130]EFL88244.1 cytochrome c-type protein [Ahrensia sp. R2A130]